MKLFCGSVGADMSELVGCICVHTSCQSCKVVVLITI